MWRSWALCPDALSMRLSSCQLLGVLWSFWNCPRAQHWGADSPSAQGLVTRRARPGQPREPSWLQSEPGHPSAGHPLRWTPPSAQYHVHGHPVVPAGPLHAGHGPAPWRATLAGVRRKHAGSQVPCLAALSLTPASGTSPDSPRTRQQLWILWLRRGPHLTPTVTCPARGRAGQEAPRVLVEGVGCHSDGSAGQAAL